MTNKLMSGGKKHKKRGGSASSYGSYVWGSGEQQHSISPDTNVIAAVNDPTKFTGGNVLTTVGVPAILIAANQMYNPKKRFNKSKRSMRKMMGGADPDAMLADAQKMMSNMNPTVPSVVYSSNLNPPALPQDVAKINGGELNNSKVGAGILTNIAVPAVLITANQMYKRKSIKGRKNTYKNKRSRKYSSKRRYKL